MKKIYHLIYILLMTFSLIFAVLKFTSTNSYIDEVNTPMATDGIKTEVKGFSPSICVTKNGKKYHKSDCVWIRDSEIIRYTKNNAINMGYEACSACQP